MSSMSDNASSSWSRHPGQSPDLCIECGLRPPAKPRRICKPCRSARVQAQKKTELVERPPGRSTCTVEGCNEPRHENPSQRHSWCYEHQREKQKLHQRAARRRAGIPIKPIHLPPEGTVIPEGCKWCWACNEVKEIDGFPANRRSSPSGSQWCKACEYACYKRQLEASPEHVRGIAKRSYNKNRRRRLYGITNEEFDAMVAVQDGRCPICDRQSALVIDHCHTLGLLRGVICNPCNVTMGMARDDPAVLRKLADYLDEFYAAPARPSIRLHSIMQSLEQ